MADGGKELEGQVVLVTGGAVGIGRATAELVARSGGIPIVCGRNEERLNRLEAEFTADGLTVTTARADVSVAGEVERLVAESLRRHGRIDGLVCAAGTGALGPVDTFDEADWHRSVSSKLLGSFLPAKAVLPTMRTQGSGTIVFVASVHGHATIPGRDAIAPVNAAMTGFARALAVGNAQAGVRVNSVSPGPVETPTWRENWVRMYPGRPFEDIVAEVGAAIPIGRIAQPDDVAGVIGFLLSRRSCYLTGIDIPVDGGLLARLAMPIAR
jgi:NAD(P)-dependent dehydrogenase (short-subunit alcohol dehydrogenase family)